MLGELSEPDADTAPVPSTGPTPGPSSDPLSSAPTEPASSDDSFGAEDGLIQVGAMGAVQTASADKSADEVVVSCEDAPEVRRIANRVVSQAQANGVVNQDSLLNVNRSLEACSAGTVYASTPASTGQRGVYDFGWPFWLLAAALGGWLLVMAKRRRRQEETE